MTGRYNAARAQRRTWKAALQRVLDRHNGLHASRAKPIGHATRAARASGLFRIFQLLHDLGFPLAPANIGGRHVKALVAYWTADPAFAAKMAERRARVAPLAVPYSPAYIQQQLSFLRVFCGWIGKGGLVLPAQDYAAVELVRRAQCATRDRSWSGNGVDAGAVLEAVARIDPCVALQLEVMIAFGLRRKEAVMFAPRLAEVPAHALPASAPATGYLAFVRVKRGTKGGQVRYTAIRHPAQQAALARALAAAPYEHSHIGRPGLSLKQALDRFSYVLRAAGVTRRALGVTGHGLRHQFASDLYFELTEIAAPVRGGAPVDAATMAAAYLEVARQLGHSRPQISGAYLGARRGTRHGVGRTP